MNGPERKGWGFVGGARKSHFFVGDKSLCGRWGVWGRPEWAAVQSNLDKPHAKRCSKCWTLAVTHYPDGGDAIIAALDAEAGK